MLRPLSAPRHARACPWRAALKHDGPRVAAHRLYRYSLALLRSRRRLAEVGGPIDLLARVGHRDLRALREIHVRIAALDDTADERDRHAGLHGRRAPAKLL